MGRRDTRLDFPVPDPGHWHIPGSWQNGETQLQGLKGPRVPLRLGARFANTLCPGECDIQRETVQERKKIVYFPNLNSTFSLSFEPGAHTFIFHWVVKIV